MSSILRLADKRDERERTRRGWLFERSQAANPLLSRGFKMDRQLLLVNYSIIDRDAYTSR